MLMACALQASYAEAVRLGDATAAVALEDAQKARDQQKLNAELLPAAMAFAQRKQEGTRLLQEKSYAAAAAECRGALASM